MCGIAGIINLNRAPVADLDHKLGIMNKLQKHRGPDGEGIWCHPSGRVGLAHVRLSIIDLSPAGSQPMTDSAGNWIVYNGEIYNFGMIREELRQKGFEFRTKTDTEVIVAAYDFWGEGLLDRLDGMWAFVIYDHKRKILFGSRDRFGVKPLYYYHRNGRFAFASEVKSLMCLPFLNRELDREVLCGYLATGSDRVGERSFLKHVHEIPHGHAFIFDLRSRRLNLRRYYTLPFVDAWERFDPDRCQKHIFSVRERIFSSIQSHIVSDVPVGTCLSGGIDSSSIVCVINTILKKRQVAQIGERQKAFTACYQEEGLDESHWAACVSKSTDLLWHKVFPTSKDFIHDLEDLVYCQDYPFASTSIYAQYCVTRLTAKTGVKVLLDGQGGDELFTGYASYYATFLAEMARSLAWGDFAREWRNLENAPIGMGGLIKDFAKLHVNLIPKRIVKSCVGAMRPEIRYISRDLWNAYPPQNIQSGLSGIHSLNSLLDSFMNRVSLQTLLRYEDRNSMRFSIEARTPFADDKNLIEYVFGVPSVYKIHNGWSKYLLRKSMEDLLPEEVFRRRDKIGFATPERHWLAENGGHLLQYLSDDLMPYIDVASLRRDWCEMLARQNKSGITRIWPFINLAIWMRVYGFVS
jgi:asparagine synthase (glutamine-hydrolysing)